MSLASVAIVILGLVPEAYIPYIRGQTSYKTLLSCFPRPVHSHQHSSTLSSASTSEYERVAKRPNTMQPGGSEPSRSASKRLRGAVQGRPAYPRKRAAQACLTCRRKRIKCDNERPSCTSCTDLGVECVYSDGDKSSYDSASLAILQRLDHLEELFKAAHPEATGPGPADPQPYPYPAASPIPAPELFTPAATSNRDNSSAPCPISIETILDWPCLRPYTPPRSFDVKSLLRTDRGNLESRALLSSDIDAQGASSLLQLFLDNFHIYNPVLKVPDVEEYVNYTVFNGLGWDAKSCLLVCHTDPELGQEATIGKRSRLTMFSASDLRPGHYSIHGCYGRHPRHV